MLEKFFGSRFCVLFFLLSPHHRGNKTYCFGSFCGNFFFEFCGYGKLFHLFSIKHLRYSLPLFFCRIQRSMRFFGGELFVLNCCLFEAALSLRKDLWHIYIVFFYTTFFTGLFRTCNWAFLSKF